mmetsp:Transcript_1551/g.2120  ORF Transcript_1551/g.2120 Transcript_1551/m.2120 type:complete len:373 (-) Transcript_1551:672-1790(-)
MGNSQPSVINLDNDDGPSLSSELSNETVNWETVRQIVREEPEQACIYAHGLEPSQLWVAVSRSGPTDVVQLIYEAYEDALDDTHPSGQTLLHLAVQQNEPEEIVEFILKHRPSMTQFQDQKGRLPLHLCTNAATAGKLIHVFREALYQRSKYSGSLPLHYALTRQQVMDTQFLQVLVPERRTILSRNKKGHTPLQLLVEKLENDFNEDIWEVLLGWIQILEPPDKNSVQTTMLHTLIEYGVCSSEHLMNRALQEFPYAYKRDQRGRTPLHVAVSTDVNAQALEILLRANPKAPRMTDNEGRLPIDLAAESSRIPLKGLAMLMKGEPRAIDTRDLRDGHYPFVSAALEDKGSVNNTYFLLRAKPEVLSYFHNP